MIQESVCNFVWCRLDTAQSKMFVVLLAQPGYTHKDGFCASGGFSLGLSDEQSTFRLDHRTSGNSGATALMGSQTHGRTDPTREIGR